MASDVLQETFINTVPAWVNMLLLSAVRPHPDARGRLRDGRGVARRGRGRAARGQGRCDARGRLRRLRGGGLLRVRAGARASDDGGARGGSHAPTHPHRPTQMGATSSAAAEAAAGREPAEMCRPMATTRGGFMEAQGAGVQVRRGGGVGGVEERKPAAGWCGGFENGLLKSMTAGGHF